MKLTKVDISKRVDGLYAVPPAFDPVIPDLDRLLGPAKPIDQTLAELDEQYRANGKYVDVYFLPLDEPLSPHLDTLLGPAKPYDQIMTDFEIQYHKEGQYPDIYFLPLSDPFRRISIRCWDRPSSMCRSMNPSRSNWMNCSDLWIPTRRSAINRAQAAIYGIIHLGEL